MTEHPALQVLQARIEALEAIVNKNETTAHAELAAALEAHRQLHVAHDVAHVDYHTQTQTALERAAAQARELAVIHASAHEREHKMTHEAVEKAHDADIVRFEHLNEAGARAIEERSTFANKEATEDKLNALADRLSALERVGQGSADRVALVNTTVNRVGALENELIAARERLTMVSSSAARLDALEKAQAIDLGRDRGVSLVWAVLIALAALVIGAVGLLLKFGG